MTQKILLTIDIDDSQLDAAQAKADKLVATLKQAEALADKLNLNLPPTNTPDWDWHESITCRLCP